MIDLLQHHQMAGVSLTELEQSLTTTCKEGRWDRELLYEMAEKYGAKETRALVERCLSAAHEAS